MAVAWSFAAGYGPRAVVGETYLVAVAWPFAAGYGPQAIVGETNLVAVAQLVERRIVVPNVVGSSPISHPICRFRDFNNLDDQRSADPSFQISLQILI